MYFYDVILTRKIVPYIRHGYYIKNKVVVFSTQLLEFHCPFLAFWVKPRIEIETLMKAADGLNFTENFEIWWNVW